MGSTYKYKRDGEEHGPFTAREMRALAADGSLRPLDLIWMEGTTSWVPASKLKGLFDEPAEPKASSAAAAAAAVVPIARSPHPHPHPAPAAPVAPATPVASVPPPSPTANASQGTAAVRKGLKRGLEEAKEVARASAEQGRRLVVAGKDKLEERRLRGEAETAQAAFGEWLSRAGLGDADLRAQLAQVDERLLSQATARKSTRDAADERLRLQATLAVPYLTHTPPPGAEVVHQRAVAARQALNDHLAIAGQARGALLPSSSRDRLRVTMGVVSVLALVFVMFLMFRGGPSPSTALSPSLSPSTPNDPGYSAESAPADDSLAQSEPAPQPSGDEGGSPAKQAAMERMLAAQGEYEQAAAMHNAAHQQYRMARDNALGQGGRRGAIGLPPAPPVAMPDPSLQLRMIQAKQAFDQAKREYEETP